MILGIFRLVDDRSPFQLDCMAQPGRDVNSVSTVAVDTRSPTAANTGVRTHFRGRTFATMADELLGLLALAQSRHAQQASESSLGFRLSHLSAPSCVFVSLCFTINDGLH